MHEQPARFLLLAAWFGLVTGFGEISVLGAKKFILHRFILLDPHVAWMAPLADVYVFAIPGLILFFVAWCWPRLASLYLAAVVFAFLGFLSLLLVFHPSLHKYAALLLAAGLAVQTARFIAAHAQGFHALVRGTVGWMVALGVGLAVGVHGWQLLAERRALAKLPPADPGAPNVLLIVLDTVRAHNLSLYGYERPTTPRLERLAKTGVRFKLALSTSPWTLPSHASMFTGRFPHEVSADWFTPLDATYPTLAEVLSGQGYMTAGFVANTFYCSYEHGLSRGFAHYEDYHVSPVEIIINSSLGRTIANRHGLRQIVGYYEVLTRKTAPEVNGDFLRWLSRQHRRPFFVFLNYYDAHEPYLPPEPFDVQFGPKTHRRNFLITHELRRGVRWDRRTMSPQEIQTELDAYDGSIAYLDYHLGLLFDELEKRGVLQNTLIIITSDHGEQFGEHRLFSHGNSLYLPLLHVPLLISFPSRVPAGTSVRVPVSLRDVPATVIDLIGRQGGARFPGTSLARYWKGAYGTAYRAADTLLSELKTLKEGDMKSLVEGRYHYVRNGDGREELYDLASDPLETYDLARTEAGRQALVRFRVSLQTILQRAGVHLVSRH